MRSAVADLINGQADLKRKGVFYEEIDRDYWVILNWCPDYGLWRGKS